LSKKILFIVHHRKGRSPGQRFRFEQYLDYLKENDIDHAYSNILSERDDKLFYSKGKYFQKLNIVIKSFFHRCRDLKTSKNFDIAFIYREAFMLGTVFFEKKLKKKTKLIFDFDDAIWLKDVSQGNMNLSWLKWPRKTNKILKIADLVFAGNEYLAEYARRYNNNVMIIPTTIDTDYHKSTYAENKSNAVCIGWTGTSTTLKHFETAIPYLKRIKEKYGKKVYFKIIVNFPYEVKELDLVASQWNYQTEIADLNEFEIGIMPLPDDEWAKGKCGFKGLQYMAMEIPTIMSPVGVNKEIIKDGFNGFLAESDDEWVEKISTLIDSGELRKRMGAEGRQTVLQNYSVESQKNNYLNAISELINK